MKSLLSLLDLDQTAVTRLLNRADELHDLWHRRQMPQAIRGRHVALWFYRTGFRNRLAFEIGIRAMGGDPVYVPGELGAGESAEDIARYLSNWFDLLIVRSRSHDALRRFAENSSVPVINARTDRGHPCEILGDLQFVRRHRGNLDNLRVVFVGEHTNLCRSWLEAATILPIHVTQVCPQGYELPAAEFATLTKQAVGTLAITHTMEEILAMAPVDVLYTDCRPKGKSESEISQIRKNFLPYQIAVSHLDCLSDRGVFLPCPPVTRGEEATAEAVSDQRNLNYRAKEFLLHSQNALVETILIGNDR